MPPTDSLDVLRVDVATADDDEVLDPAAHRHLPVDQVGQIAGLQPAVVEQLPVDVVAPVVAGRDRRAPYLEFADLPLAEFLTRLVIDDPELEARYRTTE